LSVFAVSITVAMVARASCFRPALACAAAMLANIKTRDVGALICLADPEASAKVCAAAAVEVIGCAYTPNETNVSNVHISKRIVIVHSALRCNVLHGVEVISRRAG